MTDKEVQNVIDKYKHVSIDLGSGNWKNKGFIGVDIRPGDNVDIVQDLQEPHWNIPSECADLVVASHLVEHINPANFGFINFMNEAWRILKPGCMFMVACPYAGSPGYWQDPTHVNPVTERTLAYFDPLCDNSLYMIYEPAPWKVKEVTWQPNGNMEFALEKRPDDLSYHADQKRHYGVEK